MNSQYTQPATKLGLPPDNDPAYSNLFISSGEGKGWIIEPQLTYHRIIGKGAVDALVGTTFQDNSSNQFANLYQGFSSDALIANPGAAINKTFGGYTFTQYRYNSVYARIGYNWEEKYLLNVTARRDGSSRFGHSKQFGNFGSAGLGWVFSKEQLIEKGFPWLSFGKLRAS